MDLQRLPQANGRDDESMAGLIVRDEDGYIIDDGKPMSQDTRQGRQIVYGQNALEAWADDRPDVLVACDLTLSYREGSPNVFVVPDVLIAFDVGKHDRPSYKVWEEAVPPAFVLEVLSHGTWQRDVYIKRTIYAAIGVQEFWIADPHGLHLDAALAGYSLVDGRYAEIAPLADGSGIVSDVLGLVLYDEERELRIRNPQTGKIYRPYTEVDEQLEEANARIAALEAELRRHRGSQ